VLDDDLGIWIERLRKLIGVSIHAPRAGRDHCNLFVRMRMVVSIHAPRAGRDHVAGSYSLLSSVSIHAPRAGRDLR